MLPAAHAREGSAICTSLWGFGTVRSRRFGLGPVVQVTESCELMGFVYPSVLIGRFAGIQRLLVKGLGFGA